MKREQINRFKLYVVLGSVLTALPAFAILAGGEFSLPADSPSSRIDPLTAASPYNFVGALESSSGALAYRGTAVALSANWVLTAGHNVDLNDDGQADPGLSLSFHLPGFGSYAVSSVTIQPQFTGFNNPSIHHDLSLLYFSDALPDLFFPALGLSLKGGDVITLAGFGRSGYGSYGYTTGPSLTDRRIGFNTVNDLEYESGGSGILFHYNFDHPDSPESLGNHLETIVAPGDSGGPALIDWEDGFALTGINTFTQGYGGKFGDIGGGVVLDPYWDWIHEVTGLAMIPEPGTVLLFFIGLGTVFLIRRKKTAKERPE